MTQDRIEEHEAEIHACVRIFYERVAADELIGPIFAKAIGDWDRHLGIMDDFWSAALLGTRRYTAAPFAPHLKLEMTQEHFDRWLAHWTPSVEETLPEPLRAKALGIGQHMSHCWGRAYMSMKNMAAGT